MYQNKAYHFSYNLTQQKHNANLALHEYKQRWVMEPISSIHYTYYNVFHLINVSFFITYNYRNISKNNETSFIVFWTNGSSHSPVYCGLVLLLGERRATRFFITEN